MSALLERVRAALAADFEVTRELASGGMGIVFAARERTLDRQVAIKIIHPSWATATAAERFLREARALASLSHPNIVPIHRAGEADGLAYYVMDYVDVPTLEARLAGGALGAVEAEQLADDLLAALEAVHARGMVHRDVKPANIFVRADGHAILTDFGIAKSSGEGRTALTAPGHMIGTPGYMPPEQAAGAEVGPRADVCAAGMVIFEALTGRRWVFDEASDAANWTGVPRRLAPALRRALAWRPQERWSDAAAFRRALTGAGRRPVPWERVAAVAVAGIAVVGWLVGRPARTASRAIAIAPFAVRGAAVPPWLGDSLAAALPERLGANADVRFVRGASDDALVTLTGTVSAGADSSFEVSVGAATGGAVWAHARGRLGDWQAAADSLAWGLTMRFWVDEDGPLAGQLPRDAMPHSRRGLEAFITAERLYAQALWTESFRAYEAAWRSDSTCLLCLVRLEDIARWLRLDHDSARVRRYTAARDRFTPVYQMMIDAARAPPMERMELLRRAAELRPPLFLASFVFGDEIFHRGPLLGQSRRDALEHLREVVRLEPRFGPGWEHLAELAIGAGNRAEAESALARFAPFAARDPISGELHLLNQVAFLWRFLPAEVAAGQVGGALARPETAAFPDLHAGPTFLLTFDAPHGVVWLGETFARGVPRANLEVPGLLAQIHGHLALGRPDSALALARLLQGRTTDPALALYLSQLPALLAVADSAAPPGEAALRPLARIAGDHLETPARRRRAAWTLALAARRSGNAAAARRWHAAARGTGADAAFASLLDADSAALAGRPRAALTLSEPLLALDSNSSARIGDPFFRALLHLMRAQWFADAGAADAAVRSLRWYENADIASGAGLAVQSVEVDWALGTLARWRMSRLLGVDAPAAAACRALRDVERLWIAGEPAARARSREAGRRAQALHCPS